MNKDANINPGELRDGLVIINSQKNAAFVNV